MRKALHLEEESGAKIERAITKKKPVKNIGSQTQYKQTTSVGLLQAEKRNASLVLRYINGMTPPAVWGTGILFCLTVGAMSSTVG